MGEAGHSHALRRLCGGALRRGEGVIVAAIVATGGVWALCVAAMACDGSDLQLCGQIPDAGCPIGRGGSCDDLACGALYDCVEGVWRLVRTCEPLPQGGSGGAGGGATAGAGGAISTGGCDAVELDHTGETQGCLPDLQEPDCPAVAAEACAPCLTGCADFFMCLPVGWVDVAYCTAEGELVVAEP